MNQRVVLVHQGQLYISWTGEVCTENPIGKLIKLIIQEDSFYIAGTNLYLLIAEIDKELQNLIQGWRARFSNRRRRIHNLNGKETVSGHLFADYIAISKRDHTRKRCRSMKRFEIMNLELFKNPVPKLPDEQMTMAITILDMCDQRGVKFKATRGSLAASMLKASPKWEKGRRSAFPFINKHARKHMPGSYYATSNKIRRDHIKGEKVRLNPTMDHCYLIDQYCCHHNIVSEITLPHPEDLRARGFWKEALKGEHRHWCHPYSAVGKKILEGELVGLFLVRIHVTHIGPTVQHLQIPLNKKSGLFYQWLWTPDLRIIEQTFQIVPESICCAMAGVKDDEALKEYANWSLDEIAKDPSIATYKKAILLSAYGMLALNPLDKPLYRYFSGTVKHNPVHLPRGGEVNETRIQLPENVEPSIVNVINRGLIESEQRARSIEYARELHALGYHVAQIYADAILVETDSLPFIKEGWRVTHSLNEVWIPRPNAFMSDSISKLPGVAKDDVDSQIWRERYEDAKRPFVRS